MTPFESHSLKKRLMAEFSEDQAETVLKLLSPELTAWAEYENAINWHTECLSCANMLTACIKETVRAETAENERDAAIARAADRCASCDHQRTYHDADGQCWFTVDWGRPDSNLVCPCAPRPDTVEDER